MENKSGNSGQTDEKEKMERIRNLLIGKNYDELDQRLNRLDQKYEETISKLKSELLRKQEEQHSHSSENIKSLSEKIEEVYDNHKKNIDEIRNDISMLNKALDGFFREKEKEIGDLKQQLENYHKKLEEKTEQKTDEIKSQLLKEIADLKKDKMSRSFIASLLSEAALQIGTGEEEEK